MAFTHKQRIDRRNKKVQTAFSDLAPVWLLNDTYHPARESFVFNVVYCNSVHGWINQQMRYDNFNDVLYRLGETYLSESEILQLEEQVPYIPGDRESCIPNNPGNRL